MGLVNDEKIEVAEPETEQVLCEAAAVVRAFEERHQLVVVPVSLHVEWREPPDPLLDGPVLPQPPRDFSVLSDARMEIAVSPDPLAHVRATTQKDAVPISR